MGMELKIQWKKLRYNNIFIYSKVIWDNDLFEKYGIDFMSLVLNLKIQEDELKQVKRAVNER